MKRRHTLATYTDATLNDTTIISALIEPALENLDTNRGGYPPRTPGANPGSSNPTNIEYDDNNQPVHDTNSSTERSALTPDTADRDQKQIKRLVLAGQRNQRALALLVQKWAGATLNRSQVLERLTAIDELIWCANHIKHGMQEPRREGDLCTYCATFQKTRKRLPPVEVLDHRARNSRISETHTIMLLAKAETREAAEKATAKAAAKLAKQADKEPAA